MENFCCNCHFYEGVKGAHGYAPCKINGKMTMWDDSCEKIWLVPERLTIVKLKARTVIKADQIRAMNDEELAEFVVQQRFCALNPIADTLGIDITPMLAKCRDNVLEWLKQEAEEGK